MSRNPAPDLTFYDPRSERMLRKIGIKIERISAMEAIAKLHRELKQVWTPGLWVGRALPVYPSCAEFAQIMEGYLGSPTTPTYTQVIVSLARPWPMAGVTHEVIANLAENSKNTNPGGCTPAASDQGDCTHASQSWVHSWLITKIHDDDLSVSNHRLAVAMIFLRCMRLYVELMRLAHFDWKCPIIGLDLDAKRTASMHAQTLSTEWPKRVRGDRLIEIEHCIPNALRLSATRKNKSCSPYRLTSAAANRMLGSIPWRFKAHLYAPGNTDLRIKEHYDTLFLVGSKQPF